MKNLFLLMLSIISLQQVRAQHFAWVQHWGGQEQDITIGIATVTDVNGNIFVTGSFGGTMDADPGPAVVNLVSAGSRDIFVSKFNASGTLLWTKQISGTDDGNVATITTDPAGNIYIAGTYAQTTDFDPGPGVFELQYSVARNSYICKLDNAGNFIWAKGFIGDLSEIADIAVDADQNIYTTGTLYTLTDFDPGPGVYNLDAQDAYDMFVCKLDADGEFLWAKQVSENGDTANVSGVSIAFDSQRNVYITGQFNGTADFDPGAGTFNLTATGPQSSKEIFVCKLDVIGNFLWAGSFTGPINEEINNILVDEDDNAYLTGNFWGTVDFDPGPGTFGITASPTGGNTFLCKLNGNGNLVWAKSFSGGNMYQRGSAITQDHIYTTGYFRGTIDFDPGIATHLITTTGDWDIFVSKMDLDGNFVWANKFGDVVGESASAIAVDRATDNVFLIGHCDQTSDLDPSDETWRVVSKGLAGDVFLLKLSECTPNNGITQGKESCTQYIWPENGGLYTTSGSYWHILTSSTGCDSTVKLNLTIADVDYINQISMNGQYLNVSTSASIDHYKWINCATFAVLGTEETYLPTANGSYALIATAGDCVDTSACFNVTSFGVGLNELEAAGFALYPNPVSDHLVFQSSNAIQPFEIEITSVNGQLAHKATYFSGDKITTEKWPAGIYLVKIISNEKSYVTRIVKK